MSELSLITTREAAAELGVTARSVARMVKRGALPYVVKVPGQTGAYLFDPAAISAHADMAAGSSSFQEESPTP